MKLPKSFTTVTPLSKIIALSMFIILPILAFFYGTYYQHLVDMGNTHQTIIEYKVIKSPSPMPTQGLSNAITCRKTSDCHSGYFCTATGPIVYNSKTRKSSSILTCHKNGTMIPL